MTFSGATESASAQPHGLVRRRTVLQGLAAAGVASGAVPIRASTAAAQTAAAFMDGQVFDRTLASAIDRMRFPGAAVAVVTADSMPHTVTLGSRSLQPRRP